MAEIDNRAKKKKKENLFFKSVSATKK